MSLSFNLIDEPWIPCLRPDNTLIELGLREAILRAHEVREIAAESPLTTGALYRLLLTLLHRVYGPADEDAWLALWQAGRWEAGPLDAYLGRWRDRFDLFDPQHPFLQRADPRAGSVPAAVVVPELWSRRNPTLFQHYVEDLGIALTPPQAARAMLATLSFGLAGTSGLGTNYTFAPCVDGAVFLAEGDSLFETLCLNLARYPRPEDGPDDRPAWEVDDPSQPRRDRPLGRLDLYTWPNRNILLIPESHGGSVVVREATMAPNLPLHPDVLDPMKCFRVDAKRGHLPLRFTEERALWRDVTVLLAATESSRPPLAAWWLRRLAEWGYLPRGRRLRFVAMGMANDQAKVNFIRAERLPLPLEYLAEKALVDAIEEALRLAEEVARQLWGAAQTLARVLLSPENGGTDAREPRREDVASLTGQWAVERHYWSRLELPFRELLVALPGDLTGSRLAWRETLRTRACEALEWVCRSFEQDLRRIKAVVRARDQLRTGLARVLRTEGS